MRKWIVPALAALAVASVGSVAQAGILTITVSGVFDSADDVLDTSTNGLAPLVGQPYTMSITTGTGNTLLIRTQVGVGGLPDVGYFYATSSSISTLGGGYPEGYGGVVDEVDEFNYDGSKGIVPAGTYDQFEITAWFLGAGPVVDPAACGSPTTPAGSLLGGTPPGPCSLKGYNLALDVTLSGYQGFVSDFSSGGLAGLDFSQVVYGSTDIREFDNGYFVGDADQDPALTYADGVLSGPDMMVSFTYVPEPATWAMLVLGVAAIGAAMRRRERPGSAAA